MLVVFVCWPFIIHLSFICICHVYCHSFLCVVVVLMYFVSSSIVFICCTSCLLPFRFRQLLKIFIDCPFHKPLQCAPGHLVHSLHQKCETWLLIFQSQVKFFWGSTYLASTLTDRFRSSSNASMIFLPGQFHCSIWRILVLCVFSSNVMHSKSALASLTSACRLFSSCQYSLCWLQNCVSSQLIHSVVFWFMVMMLLNRDCISAIHFWWPVPCSLFVAVFLTPKVMVSECISMLACFWCFPGLAYPRPF